MGREDPGDKGGKDKPDPSSSLYPTDVNFSSTDIRTVQQAKLVFALSNGPVAGAVWPLYGSDLAHSGLRDVYMNDVAILNSDGTSNFNGVAVGMTSGTLTQKPIGGFNFSESLFNSGVEITHATPQIISVAANGPTSIRINLSMPVIYNQDPSNGNMYGTTVDFLIEVSNNGGAWTSVNSQLGGAVTINGMSTSTVVRPLRVHLAALGSGPWQVRITRVTADNHTTTLKNQTYLQSYSTIVDYPLSHPSTALLAVALDAAHFSSMPKISVRMRGRIVSVPTNYTPASKNPSTGLWTAGVYDTTVGHSGVTAGGGWDGTFKQAWTCNPAWIFMDMATNPVYGAGKYISQSFINKWVLYTISQYCDQTLISDGFGGQEPRFSFNGYLETPDEAFKVLAYIMSCARSQLYYAAGQVAPVQDSDGTPVALFTRSNVLEGKFSYAGTARKARHTICNVSWNDPGQVWKVVPETVTADDASLQRYGLQTLNVSAVGCTSRGQARRYGRWALISELNELELVKFTTGVEGITARPGDLILIQDPGRKRTRLGGRVVSATTTSLVLDSPVALLAGQSYTLYVQLTDGSVVSSTVTTAAGTTSTITVGSALPVPPAAQAQWLLSCASTVATRWRVVSIKEDHTSDTKSYEIQALSNYQPKYVQADNTDNLVASTPTAVGTYLPPTAVTASSYSQKQNDRLVYLLSATWTAPASGSPISYAASYRKDAGPWQAMAVTSTTALVNDVQVGVYDVRVTAIYDGGVSTFAAATGYALTNTGGSPAEVAQGGVNQINSVDWLTNLDKGILIQDWKSEQQTKTQLDSQATTLSVPATLYDNAVAALSTNIIAAGAPAAWATTWPDGTNWNSTGIMTSLQTWWAAIASARMALMNAITNKVAANSLPAVGTAANSLLLNGYVDTTAATANTIARRDGSGGLTAAQGYFNNGLVLGNATTNGSITNDTVSGNGLLIYCHTAATYDFNLVTPTGSAGIMRVPTGTNNAYFSGNVQTQALTATTGTFTSTVYTGSAGGNGLVLSGGQGSTRILGTSNLVLNATGANALYLQWDSGSGGVLFGNGAGVQKGSIDNVGNLVLSGGATIGALAAITGTFTGAVDSAVAFKISGQAMVSRIGGTNYLWAGSTNLNFMDYLGNTTLATLGPTGAFTITGGFSATTGTFSGNLNLPTAGNLNITTSDQSNGRINLTNSTAGQTWNLIAGKANLAQTGFSIVCNNGSSPLFYLDASGNLVLSGALAATTGTFSGNSTVAGGLSFTATTGGVQQGTITYNAALGLSQWAKTGTTADWTVWNAAGVDCLHLTTGTSNFVFAGAISVTGLATFNGGITSNSTVILNGAGRVDPQMVNTSGATDQKRWDWSLDGAGGAGSLMLLTRSDTGTAGIAALNFTRTGNVCSGLTIGQNTSITGTLTVSSTSTYTGLATFNGGLSMPANTGLLIASGAQTVTANTLYATSSQLQWNGYQVYTTQNIGTSVAGAQALQAMLNAPTMGSWATFGTLPTAGTDNTGLFPVGCYIYSTVIVDTAGDNTAGTLYKNVAGTWTRTGSGNMIAGKIVAGNISAGAIGAGALSSTLVISNLIESSDYTQDGSSTPTNGFKLDASEATYKLKVGAGQFGTNILIGAVGNTTLGDTAGRAVTGIAATGTSATDVVWWRGNSLPAVNNGAPVIIDQLWALDKTWSIGDRVIGGATSALPTYASGCYVYQCTTAGTGLTTTQQTSAAWSSATTYAIGNTVSLSNRIYSSKTAGNLNNTPVAGGTTYWTDLGLKYGPIGTDKTTDVYPDGTAKWKCVGWMFTSTSTGSGCQPWVQNTYSAVGALVCADPVYGTTGYYAGFEKLYGNPTQHIAFPGTGSDASVTNYGGTRIYRCITAGTSSTTGNGPSGTGTSISDGTAVWAYWGENTGPGDRVQIWAKESTDPGGTITWGTYEMRIQPKTNSDNLDALTHLEVEILGVDNNYKSQGTVRSQFNFAVPSRKYYSPSTPDSIQNMVRIDTVVTSHNAGDTSFVYGSGNLPLQARLRIRLHNVNGVSAPVDYGLLNTSFNVPSPYSTILTAPPVGGGGGGGGGYCPEPWVLVLTNRGEVPASEVVVGDIVPTKHETTGEAGNFQVTAVEPGQNETGMLIFSKTDNEGNTSIKEVAFAMDHRFKRDGNWIELRSIMPGSTLDSTDGSLITVLGVESRGLNEVVRITVDEAHTYSTEGILSHNIKLRNS